MFSRGIPWNMPLVICIFCVSRYPTRKHCITSIYNIHGDHNGKTVKLVAFSMEDCGYKSCVHQQMVCNDIIFVFNVNCVNAFRWAVRLFKRPF